MNQNVEPQDIEASYRDMAADQAREHEALEWSGCVIADGQTKVGRTPSSARDPLVALLRLSSTSTLDGMLKQFAESPRCVVSPNVGNPGLCLSVFIRVHPWPLIPRHFEVFDDGVPNVRQGLLFGSALRPAPREPRAGNAIPLFGWN